MYVERRLFSETGFDQRLYLPPEVIIELMVESFKTGRGSYGTKARPLGHP
jgi:hypothetical protein